MIPPLIMQRLVLQLRFLKLFDPALLSDVSPIFHKSSKSKLVPRSFLVHLWFSNGITSLHMRNVTNVKPACSQSLKQLNDRASLNLLLLLWGRNDPDGKNHSTLPAKSMRNRWLPMIMPWLIPGLSKNLGLDKASAVADMMWTVITAVLWSTQRHNQNKVGLSLLHATASKAPYTRK